jgi:hypothetical protein
MTDVPQKPEASKSRWRQILFWRISDVDRRVMAKVGLLPQPRVDFDPRWLSWLVTILAVVTGVFYWNEFVGSIVCAGFALLMCLYFLLILFRRFQCSLLEFLVVSIVLGNVEGLLLTTPGFYSLGWFWGLCIAGIAAAWILSGAASSIAAARILNVQHSAQRVILLVVHWWIAAVPALVVLGSVLAFGRTYIGKEWGAINIYIVPQMVSWGYIFLGCGVVGMIVRFFLCRRIRRVIASRVNTSTAF